MNNKILLPIIALVCSISAVFAQQSKINWQPTLLEMDGNPNDWTTNLRFFDSESNIKFELRNDAENLYFVLKTDDKSLEQQIQQAGLKLKLTIKSSPKTTATFQLKAKKGIQGMPFPSMQGGFPNQPGQMPPFPGGNPPQAGNTELMLKDFPLRTEPIIIDTAITKGFLFSPAIVTSKDSLHNTIRFAKSTRNMVESAFEIAIPLRELFGNSFRIDSVCKIPLLLQVNIGTVSQSSSTNQPRRPEGGQPGGPGGMGNPGMGGGPGGEMGERPPMPEGMTGKMATMTKKSFKLEFLLSAEQ